MDQETNSKQAVSETEPCPRTPGQSGQAGDPQTLSRRNFIKMGVGALSVLAVLEVGGASLFFLQSRNLQEEFGSVVTAGSIDSFPPGSVTEFPGGRFFLVRSFDSGFLALYSRCPHLGCTVYWAPEKGRFFCPCHASSFDFYGNFENPPVPRPLDVFPVQIEEMMVKVDTSQPQRREFFAPEQLTFA